MQSARHALRRWVERWREAPGCDGLVTWVEDYIKETFSVYRLPRAHRKHMRSTNMLERFNKSVRSRTRVVGVFPNDASYLRLILALAAVTHDKWVSGKRYLSGAIGLDKDVQKQAMKIQEKV